MDSACSKTGSRESMKRDQNKGYASKSFLGCRDKLGGKRTAATALRNFKVHGIPKNSQTTTQVSMSFENFARTKLRKSRQRISV